MTDNTFFYTLITVIVAILLTTVRWSKRRPLHDLPPGPPALPILGNVLNMPKGHEWLTFLEWGGRYASNLVHFRIFGTHVVVLNSSEASKQLFEKQSTAYSDRPYSMMIHELTGWDRDVAVMTYGDKWKACRKMYHQHFQAKAISGYHSKITRHVNDMLHSLMHSPNSFSRAIEHLAAASILDIVYAMEVKPKDDPYIGLVDRATHSFGAVTTPGAFLVDSIPLLKYLPSWLPGAGFKRQAAKWKVDVDAMYETPLRNIKEAMKAGTARTCIASTVLANLDQCEDPDEQEDVLTDVAGTSYGAGFDTIVASLSTFVLAMLLYPEAQRAAQDELDRVIGQDALPEFEDRNRLPYVTALLKEILRWRPASPIANPHVASSEGTYEGYRIPAGSLVLGNIWAALHDPSRYVDPDVFDPTRFLTSQGDLDSDVPDPTSDAFGYGRRICPGRFFAMDELWLAVANILSAFTIEKPLDDLGRTVEPSGEYLGARISMPAPFGAVFKPRSSVIVNLVH